MTIRRLQLIGFMLALWAGSASGDETKLLLIRAGALLGTTVLDAGTTAAAQTVIPRYRVDTTFPAGQLIGWGPQSLLTGTSATASTGTFKALVITAGYGDTVSEWQTQSPGTQPAVLQPIIRDITIAGYSTNNWSTGGAVNDRPFQHNVGSAPEWTQDADQYAGFRGQAGGGTLENVTLFFIPGTAAEIRRNGSELNGSYQPFDRVKWNVNKLNIRRVFRGLWMNATDSHVTDVEVEAFRNYGVRLGQYQTTGAIQFARLHCYGGGFSTDSDAPDATGGLPNGNSPAIWIDGDTCHGVDCYAENAPIGLYIMGSYAALDGFYSHTCYTANVVFAGSHGHLSKARIDVLADDWTIAYDSETDGPFEVNEILTFGGGSTGRLGSLTDDGSTGTLSVRQVSGAKPADNESITGGNSEAEALVDGTPSVSASRIGANFTNQYNTLVDSTIHPAGSSTAVALNNGTNQVLRNVVIGSFGNALSTGIDANVTLTNCHITMHIAGGATALDLVDGGSAVTTNGISIVSGGTSRVGEGNVIYVTTSNSTAIRARLPASWSTTVNAATTNDIRIDGIRYYPP